MYHGCFGLHSLGTVSPDIHVSSSLPGYISLTLSRLIDPSSTHHSASRFDSEDFAATVTPLLASYDAHSTSSDSGGGHTLLRLPHQRHTHSSSSNPLPRLCPLLLEHRTRLYHHRQPNRLHDSLRRPLRRPESRRKRQHDCGRLYGLILVRRWEHHSHGC